jgi:hypothetical protein
MARAALLAVLVWVKREKGIRIGVFPDEDREAVQELAIDIAKVIAPAVSQDETGDNRNSETAAGMSI